METKRKQERHGFCDVLDHMPARHEVRPNVCIGIVEPVFDETHSGGNFVPVLFEAFVETYALGTACQAKPLEKIPFAASNVDDRFASE